MEEWHIDLAGGTYVFTDIGSALQWLSTQANQPAMLHKVVRTHWGAYGVPGGSPWPPAPPTPPGWTTSQIARTKVNRSS